MSGLKLSQESDELGEGQQPTPGNVYSFRTSPFWEFAPTWTGRFAAFKLLGASDQQVVIAVLDGIWDQPPSLREADHASIICQDRFAHDGRRAVFGVIREWWDLSALVEARLLGRVRLNRDELEVAARVMSFAVGTTNATLHAADYVAEGEWRWAHDRVQFEAEAEQNAAKREEARAKAERRYRDRLKGLTWEQLLSETPLARWSTSPPYPSEEFTEAARKTIRNACKDLQDLGPKPKRAWVRKVLRETVEWFNVADKADGGPIETEEREDICAALEEMAFVAGQRALVEEIDEWREW
jgi:hypothetical protein